MRSKVHYCEAWIIIPLDLYWNCSVYRIQITKIFPEEEFKFQIDSKNFEVMFKMLGGSLNSFLIHALSALRIKY